IFDINQSLRELARSLQFPWRWRSDGPLRHEKGKTIMSVRFESLSRIAFSLAAAVAFTVVLASTAVSLSPIA
ncbi:hypothetical protein, partial [Proteus mirabilis]